ncbi:MAG: sulfatase [Planctomycetes bacterium]|nr:sulfatase [Planctomycetota bacterium]
MGDSSDNQPQTAPQKKRGGIYGVIGFLLVAGIVTLLVMKYLDKGKETTPEDKYTPPKHLIVISIDALRADHLGCYGYKEATSPGIDTLAKEGVVFERNYTCYPLTLPSHLTQLTGVSTLGTRVRDNLYHELPAEIQTLPEVMKAQGFRTGGFVSAHTLHGGSGIERGFEVFDDKDVRTLEPGRLTIAERSAPQTLKLAGDWIAGLGTDRFFCFVHLFDPHAPYEPHTENGDKFRGNNSARYDGEIAYTDAAISRFIVRLTELGLMKDTLLVITADHGEGLGQHDELTHGYYCFDSTTHVPLIFHGVPGIKAGTRVSGIARNYDLAPTLVELMGLDAMEFGKQAHGVSLMPAMKDPGTDMGLSAYVESHYAWLNANWAKIRGVRTKDSLTLFAGDDVMYFTDEKQLENTADKNAAAVSEARSEISRLMSSWMPPRAGTGKVRETTAGTPYPGESAVAQDFEAEQLSDTRDLPSPHAKTRTLRAYEEAELEYDSEHFSACADMLRKLIKDDPDFIMALKLLAAVDRGMVTSNSQALGVSKCKELTREAADCYRKAAALADKHKQPDAAKDIRRNEGLLLVWLNDKKAVRELADSTMDVAIDWMFHLVSYRTAGKDTMADAAAEALAYFQKLPLGLPFSEQAKRDIAHMQASEPLSLAPWEQ